MTPTPKEILKQYEDAKEAMEHEEEEAYDKRYEELTPLEKWDIERDMLKVVKRIAIHCTEHNLFSIHNFVGYWDPVDGPGVIANVYCANCLGWNGDNVCPCREEGCNHFETERALPSEERVYVCKFLSQEPLPKRKRARSHPEESTKKIRSEK